MRDRDALLISALAVVPVTLAFSVLVGAGLMRHGPPLLVSLGAGALLILPALGLTTPFRERLAWLPLGLLVWSVVVLLGFPLYFPGERAGALSAGISILTAPTGVTPDTSLARSIDAALPSIGDSDPVPPVAATAPVEPRPAPFVEPASSTDQPDEVVLPYEGVGQALSIPIGLEGRQGQEIDATIIFDTGASLTTLDLETLHLLGVRVPRDAPTLNFVTANGERTAPIVLLDQLWIGGFSVQGVTVGVCEPCAFGGSVGLLGNNVSSLFLVTVDQVARELLLRPRSDTGNRYRDIRPWLDIEVEATRWADGRIEVTVAVANQSHRDVEELVVTVQCEQNYRVELSRVRAEDSASTEVSLPLGAVCDQYTIDLTEAHW